ncbi:MAG: AAA family ATPase [Lysobacteraceae bacterium]
MSALIKRVEIQNFRSIRRASVDLNYLSILVGNNDSGKSNILRALNLFFNAETNPGRPLEFDQDNCLSDRPNRRAREIVVRVHIELPESYVETNGDEILWERRWRESGLVHDKYTGIRVTRTRRGKESRKEVELSPRSNVHALLRKIEFVYIPAIRDSEYFARLRGRIHGVISEVTGRTFRVSSQEFERSISAHLGPLTDEISRELGFGTRLALPRDLSHLFERLDFLTGEDSVSLDARGDGVKARHIPIILKFMADQRRSLQNRGAPPISVVWGYEEPENNLELRNAVALADELWQFVGDEVAQVLLTTHSPVFYNLAERASEEEPYVQTHHVFLAGASRGTEVLSNPADLDERMGTVALLAPQMRALEERIRKQNEAMRQAEELVASNQRILFVEGESDQTIFQKALRAFGGAAAEKIRVETLQSGAGHSYVSDMLQAWHCTEKHKGGGRRAAGIVDGDEPGSALRRKWNSGDGHTKHCKCFELPKPPHLLECYRLGFSVPATLEEMYPPTEWRRALAAGDLEDRDLTSVLDKARANQLFRGAARLEDIAQDDPRLYILYRFRYEAKIPSARRLARQEDHVFAEDFKFLRPFVDEILSYLDS